MLKMCCYFLQLNTMKMKSEKFLHHCVKCPCAENMVIKRETQYDELSAPPLYGERQRKSYVLFLSETEKEMNS